MDFGDAPKQVVPRFGSLVQWDNPVQLPLGLASMVRNCRYTAQSVATRWGFSNRLTIGAPGSSISGLGVLRYLSALNDGGESINLFAYTATDGNLWAGIPFVQASLAQLSTDGLYALANLARVPGLDPRITQAYNRGYAAMGDLSFGRAPAMVYDPAQNTLDPVSDKPFGVAWTPATRFRIGHMASPSTFNTFGLPAAQGVWVPQITGHLYRCVQAGISDPTTPPVWPTTTGTNVNDGTVIWQESTPTCASGLPDALAPTTPTTTADGASPIIDGATVFVVLTYNSAVGEAINDLTTTTGVLDTSKVLQFKNITGAAVDLSVVLPAIPADVIAGGPLGANGATSYNVYAYIVQGVPDVTKYTDPSFYARIAATQAAGATVTISTWPTGQSLPTVNTANIATAGDIDVGVRWMVWLFETRTEYETGFSSSAPIRINVTQAGLALFAQKAPIGPYNCIRRIAAFTVAGASSAGPYTYIDQNDVESPGFNQPDITITATTINDNVTTTATFNFTDTYLPGASNVTNYFNRIELPGASDIYFSKTAQRIIYAGVKGYPSGFLVSDLNDPEAVRVPGSNIQVSETDGDRTVMWREIRENQIALKENSGHGVITNTGDPSTWAALRLWSGSGPTGAKAAAVGVEDDAEYIVYAHRSGPYRYTGNAPQHVGREIQAVWDQINWTYGHLIVVSIDEQHREVRFSVPMGASTVRNCVLTLNFYFGWADPVIFAVRSGRLVPNVNGRKWSVDDISANEMVFIPQRYNPSGADLGGADLHNQFVIAGPDGAVYTLTENQYFDQNYAGAHVGYLSGWRSVPGSNPQCYLNQLLGAICSAIGNGLVTVYAIDDKGAIFMLSSIRRMWILTAQESQRDFGAVAIHGSRFGVAFDNGGVAGAWFEMHAANLVVAPTFATRIG